MSNIRVRTTPGGEDKFLNVKIDQKFDFIEILSLKLSQEDVYRKYCSDYGILVGRVTVNNGFGVPNAKVSIFIPVDSIDKEDSEIFGLYPYEQVQDRNSDALRYNLLPKNNETNNDCFTPVGSFFNKREVQDNPDVEYVYCKYYKFTTTTNYAGDFMLFGLPVGTHQMHVDADISNIGILSQFPYDLIREGSNENLFESATKFKFSENLNTLSQIKTRTPISVNIKPFWGDLEQCELGITRNDIDLATNIIPSAIFMGSIFSDDDKGGINKNCKPRASMGKFKNIITGEGIIEMIRKRPDGSIERYDVEGGELIDENGTWAYQVPMNLDYITTDEFGNITPTDDPNKGLPTRARVRFRVGMKTSGGEGRLRSRAKYLIPHNPESATEVDFNFSEKTRDDSLTDLYWNKIYTVANYIPRYQKGDIPSPYIGIKDIEDSQNTLFPYNKIDIDLDGSTTFSYILFSILCSLYSIFIILIAFVNLLVTSINGLIQVVNFLIPGDGINYIPYVVMKCGTERYCIGCCQSCPGFDATEDPKIQDSTGQRWLDCMSTQLALGLNMVKFNFYNDWVNGSLYSFLYKSKKRRFGNGKEKFCDWNCDDTLDPTDNDGDGQPDNKCYSGFIVDTCTKAYPQNGSVLGEYTSVPQGLIKKNNEDGEYYYSPVTRYSANEEILLPGIKLFATKIINLGSIFDCDWQGVPKLHPYLVDTTYNVPNETKIYYDSNDPNYPGDLEENGYDNLLSSITCFIGVTSNSNQCNNTKRICELGMGIDEDRRDPDTGTGSPVDGRLNNNDIENPWIRGLFTYLNSNISTSIIPLVYIDNGFSYNYLAAYYKEFRGYDYLININPPIWQFDNSYYFYFGIKPGASALQKMYKKYFPECYRYTKNELVIIIGDVIDDNPITPGSGQISFSVNGGAEPYTYQWVGPAYGEIQYLCPDPNNSLNQVNCGNEDGSQFTLSNLLGGQYTLIVTDANGFQATTTVQLDGFNGVQCELNPSPIDISGNGKVIVNINGGSGAYTIEIQGITDTSFNVQLPTASLNYCYGNCIANYPNQVNSLPAGEYIVTVTDSGVPITINGQTTTVYSECIKPLLIGQPMNIVLSVDIIDALCYNSFGQGQVLINGGVPPYDISWELTSTNNSNHQNLVNTIISTNINPSNLPSGTYNVTVVDLAGNIQNTSTVVNEPQQIAITNIVSNPPGCALSSTGHLSFNVNGANPPYSIEISGDVTVYLDNQPNGIVEFNNLPSSTNPYVINITDNNGCQISDNVIIPQTLYGDLNVSTTSQSYVDVNGNNVSRVIVRFNGGNGGPYHFRLPNGNWINLGNPYTQTLPVYSQSTIIPDYQLYQSTTPLNGSAAYEFQFWASYIPSGAQFYPYSFDYYLSEMNQQGTYAMFMGKSSLGSNGANVNSQDSVYGASTPYGCYTYKNTNGTLVNGSTPQGTLLSQP
jgi:hypothetical protein